MKDHCHYCNKALYRMYMRQGLYSVVPDDTDYRTSTGKRICQHCNDRLLRVGHKLSCLVCDTELYELIWDIYRETTIRPAYVRGISPQPDPYEGAYLRCRHCDSEIHLFE